MGLSLSERLAAQKQKTDLTPSTVDDPLPDFVQNSKSDLSPELQKGEPSLAMRVSRVAQQLAVCKRDREPQLLLEVVDMVTEALEMESAQVGTDWRKERTDRFDLPLLGDMLVILSDRLNAYAPNVLSSLIAGKSKRLQTLSDGADTRTVMHIISAAGWVIAEQQFRESTTVATKSKRRTRMSDSDMLLAGMNAALASGGQQGLASPFDDIFDTEVFIDGGAQKEEISDGLKTPGIEDLSDTDEPVTVTTNKNFTGSPAPEAPIRATAEDVIASGTVDFDDLDDELDDDADPFDSL